MSSLLMSPVHGTALFIFLKIEHTKIDGVGLGQNATKVWLYFIFCSSLRIILWRNLNWGREGPAIRVYQFSRIHQSIETVPAA